MKGRFAIGQAVRFNKRCVLSSRVPKNSKGYTHAVLISGEGDKYTGAGLIEPGTETEILDYVAHGTGTKEYPIVRVRGTHAVCHEDQLDAV